MKAIVLVQECEHTGDLERSIRNVQRLGVKVLSSWLVSEDEEYECGRLMVEASSVELLRRACQEDGFCSIEETIEG